jgi:L-serine dehydratase
MFLSIFDVFKVGVGPSSSHTMGPMIAAARFLDALRDGADLIPGAGAPARVAASLHGSLAFTGKGHATDRAVILGLGGTAPDTYDADAAQALLADLTETKTLHPDDLPALHFDPANDVIFNYDENLDGHPNGMILFAYDKDDNLCMREIYYSIGGGFVQTERELTAAGDTIAVPDVPFPFRSANDMLAMAADSGRSIAQMKRINELKYRNQHQLDEGIARIWEVMNSCINKGLSQRGILPGGLGVKRRAASIFESLEAERGNNMVAPHTINDWMSVYAMAVNEENAAGGLVVTAPTNGAAGVIPATLRYWLDHVPDAAPSKIPDFLLTAAAIGGLIKWNASISGAEVGCQGEVGSASAMAAAGLCAVMGGTPEQIENAAEIALEHHLGMTCDPIAGLVQVPCIERNGLGAIKAVSAASLSLRGDGQHLVPLDACIETMRQTGADMSSKYKETSTGGLAVNVVEC